MNIVFDPIEEVLEEIRQGRLVIVTDDANRENEGDLILAAEKATPELINFMIRYTSGVICVPMEGKDLDRLELPLMTVFPLRYREGGVLRRAGHTEAAVDLARLAGLSPAGVLAEVVNDDGSMARLPNLMEFKRQHNLKICSIENLIAYRRAREVLIERLEVISLPTDYGDFRLHLYRSVIDDVHHLALVKGIISPDEPTLVRVHSECLTGDVFGSRRCDCGDQLHSALQHLHEAGSGVLVYMRQEGRGIGLAAKIRAYKLQEEGLDTVEANEKLGFPMDLREYGTGAQILVDLGIRHIRLLTNNPKKVVGLEGYGLNIVEQLPIKAQANPHNARYLQTKRAKMGHLL
jgi:3,4-dihydroxy 2-butanone 4-phosphate synthase/GTP cyclohydrolase II